MSRIRWTVSLVRGLIFIGGNHTKFFLLAFLGMKEVTTAEYQRTSPERKKNNKTCFSFLFFSFFFRSAVFQISLQNSVPELPHKPSQKKRISDLGLAFLCRNSIQVNPDLKSGTNSGTKSGIRQKKTRNQSRLRANSGMYSGCLVPGVC